MVSNIFATHNLFASISQMESPTQILFNDKLHKHQIMVLYISY